MELEKFGVLIILLAISSLCIALDNLKIKRKYDALKDNHERLKNEVKLLQQENFYLKQYSRLDNTNW